MRDTGSRSRWSVGHRLGHNYFLVMDSVSSTILQSDANGFAVQLAGVGQHVLLNKGLSGLKVWDHDALMRPALGKDKATEGDNPWRRCLLSPVHRALKKAARITNIIHIE